MDTIFAGHDPAAASGKARGRVALICQEDVLAQAIETALTRDGKELSRAPYRAESLDTLRALAPDVIVLEARHNDPAAFGLCQTIRQTPEFARTRILLMQDTGRPIDRRRAVALGADAFLSMPFGMAALRSEVGRLLEG